MTAKTYAQLNAQLETVIRRMKKIQREISADSQPVSMNELDRLTKLGKKYTKVVKKLAKLGPVSDG